MAKVLYKPVSILVGMLAGLIATKLFEQVWALISDDDPAAPDERDAEWTEILISSAISGAIFATVRALVRRSGAKGFEKATGIWPGSENA